MADYLKQLSYWLFVGIRADVFIYTLLWLTTPTDKFCKFIQSPFGIAFITSVVMLHVLLKMYLKKEAERPSIRVIIHKKEFSHEQTKEGE